MAVLRFKNYELQYAITKEGYRDEQGDWIEGSSEWSDCIKCDLVPSNGVANVITYDDGKQVSYSHTIYMDKNAPVIKYGDHIRVVHDGMIILETDVKGSMRYQLQSKIWV